MIGSCDVEWQSQYFVHEDERTLEGVVHFLHDRVRHDLAMRLPPSRL